MFGVADRSAHYTDHEAAYAVILDAERRAAVVHGQRGLRLPGGGLEVDESAVEALLRESLEECGRPLEVLGAIGQAIQYCHGESGPLRARHRFFEARFRGPLSQWPKYQLSWAHIDETCGWFQHDSHVWAVRTLLARSRP